MLRMKGIRRKCDHHARTPSCSLARIAADCSFTEGVRPWQGCLPENACKRSHLTRPDTLERVTRIVVR